MRYNKMRDPKRIDEFCEKLKREWQKVLDCVLVSLWWMFSAPILFMLRTIKPLTQSKSISFKNQSAIYTKLPIHFCESLRLDKFRPGAPWPCAPKFYYTTIAAILLSKSWSANCTKKIPVICAKLLVDFWGGVWYNNNVKRREKQTSPRLIT